MANSGQFNTNAYETRSVQFAWSISSQSVANNTTTISWTLKGAGSDTKYYTSGPIKLVIEGETVYSSSARFRMYSGTVIASGTKTFTHLDNGTKQFSASVEAAIYTYAVNCTGSGTFTLDMIARASQPTCITYPENTQNVGSFGDTISIHMNRKSSAFTHKVTWAFGNQSGTCIDAETGKEATAVGTGFKWKIPESFMEQLPESLSGSGTIYVTTYNGSTLIGQKYCGFTATVPASVKPSCTLTLEDVTIGNTYGKPVKGLSKIKVTVNPTLAYKSPIASISIKANGVNYNGSPITTGFLSKAGTSTVTATVTDKRGRSGSVSYDMTVLDYAAPTVSALTVHRCNQDGTENARGDYVKVTFSANAFNIASLTSEKNSVTYKLQYKKSTATSYTTVSLSALLNNFSVSNYSPAPFAADGNSSYDIIVTATDRYKFGTRNTTASTAFTLINFDDSGKAITFGGVSEETNTFRNNLEFRQVGNRYSYQTGAYSGSSGYALMAVITVTGYNVGAPITFVLNRRGAKCPMKVYVQLWNISGTNDPDLVSFTYEGDNFGAFLVKTATSTWKLYVDNSITGGSYPCVQDWFTSDEQMPRLSVTFPNEYVAGTNPSVLGTYHRATPIVSRSILDAFYPVGYILLLFSHANPNTMYPGTTWQRISGAFPWFTDAIGEIGLTGGERNVTLTVDQIPAHSHGSVYSQHAPGTKSQAWYTTAGTNLAYGAVSTGGGAAHNNMPPYIQISAWRRTE
jgi:hypothetical protein